MVNSYEQINQQFIDKIKQEYLECDPEYFNCPKVKEANDLVEKICRTLEKMKEYKECS
jgi:hypothetical protein